VCSEAEYPPRGPEKDLPPRAAQGRERWVINKLRALAAWYTRGLEGGSHLRATINQTESILDLRQTVAEFFRL
jgi:tRNA-dihydrouridine synthase